MLVRRRWGGLVRRFRGIVVIARACRPPVPGSNLGPGPFYGVFSWAADSTI